MRYIASVSFGKDSTAMLLLLLKHNMPLDEVVFYDTGMEFLSVYAVRDRVKALLRERGIPYKEFYPRVPFEYLMFDKPIKNRYSTGYHYGYSWCGGPCRWGTGEKLITLDRYAERQNAMVYVGIAADESIRLLKKRKAYKLLPLIDLEYTESDCLTLCYEHGFFWEENGVRLYDILSRVSCWCCANKNLRELRNIWACLPDYWERLKKLQSKTERPMKGVGKSVFDLEKRFRAESWFKPKYIMSGKHNEQTNISLHR